MGLREVKAQRTREAIVDAGLTLFEAQGYDATTMEQIADAAEVGPSTLYRYFPTKDSILLDGLDTAVGRLAGMLDVRPLEEPLDEAIGHALHEYLARAESDAAHILRLRAQLDRAPGPRARLWDWFAQERVALEESIARRSGVEPDELWVGVAAHTAMMVAMMALDLRRSTIDGPGTADWADRIIRLLDDGGAVVPRLPGGRERAHPGRSDDA